MNKRMHKYIIEVYKVVDGSYHWSYLNGIDEINGQWYLTTCARAENAMGFVSKSECMEMARLINRAKLPYKAMIMDAKSCLWGEGSITEEEYIQLINEC